MSFVVIAATSIAIAGVVAGPVRAGLAPAAVGKATVVAARPLDTAVGISHASADEDGASSEAVGVRALGKDVAKSKADGNATRSDAVADVPLPVTSGRVQVMPRKATADSDGEHSRSDAHSDLVTAHIPNLVSLEVVSSDAEAVWTPRASSSGSQVEGAKVSLGNGSLVIVLMHADGSSDGRGRLYLVRINDAVFVDSQRGGHMTLAVPDIFTIELAGAHARSGRFTGQVVRAAWLDNTTLDQFAAAVDASGGSVGETHALRAAPSDRADVEAAGSGRLPLSGSPIVALVLAALTLIELGAATTLVRTAGRARS